MDKVRNIGLVVGLWLVKLLQSSFVGAKSARIDCRNSVLKPTGVMFAYFFALLLYYMVLI